MFKRGYAVFALMAALGVGGVFAQSAETQKDKAKEKTKEKTKESQSFAYSARPFSIAFNASGGSYLGVYLEEVTPERMKELGLAEERGAIIMKVVEASPAEKAGLKENDVVVSFNGHRVDSVRELQRLLSDVPAGRTVSVEVIRSGNHQTLQPTLNRRSESFHLLQPDVNMPDIKIDEQALKRNEEAMKQAEKAMKLHKEELKKHRLELNAPEFGNFNFVGPGEFAFFRGGRLGIGVETLTDQLGEFFGVKDGKGVLVTEVSENTPAAKAGLKAGDVITAVDNEKVEGLGSLLKAISKKPEGQVTLTIIRNRQEQTVNVTLEKNEGKLTPRRARPAPRYFHSV